VGQDAEVSTARSSSGFGAWKKALRKTPGGAIAVKAIVFLAGLLFILLGLALAALPGPLTIPPILVGLYIWSTEFAWAERLLDRAKRSAQEAWEKAKRRPVLTGLVTVSGLVAFGVGLWLVAKYDLVERAKDLVGLG
jgi:hypothetical protein